MSSRSARLSGVGRSAGPEAAEELRLRQELQRYEEVVRIEYENSVALAEMIGATKDRVQGRTQWHEGVYGGATAERNAERRSFWSPEKAAGTTGGVLAGRSPASDVESLYSEEDISAKLSILQLSVMTKVGRSRALLDQTKGDCDAVVRGAEAFAERYKDLLDLQQYCAHLEGLVADARSQKMQDWRRT